MSFCSSEKSVKTDNTSLKYLKFNKMSYFGNEMRCSKSHLLMQQKNTHDCQNYSCIYNLYFFTLSNLYTTC